MAELRVAQLVECTEAEGPGRRFSVWVQGCTLRCPGCCNPEMFSVAGGRTMEVAELFSRLQRTPGIEGLSLLGGEPFEQAEACAELAERVRTLGHSVMVYTGYRLAELQSNSSFAVARLLSAADLLLDGRYDARQPESRRRWVGSSNQIMHFLTGRYSPEDPRFAAPNTLELRLTRGGLGVNGWPHGSVLPRT